MDKNRAHIGEHGLLLEAVREAELLLDYISRQGLEFDKNTAAAIVRAKHLFASETWAPQDEAEFWEAYNTAARGVAPVTVASIKAMVDPPVHSLPYRIARGLTNNRYRASASSWFAMKYGLCTLSILLALVMFQFFWSSGLSMLDKLDKHKKAFETIRSTFSTLKVAAKKQPADDPEVKKVIGELRRERASYEADLRIFKQFWVPSWLMQDGELNVDQTPPQIRADSHREAYVSDLASVGAASLGLQMVQLYVLPLLYGLLGAAAYVLRTLSVRIKNITYVPAANTGFGLRMQLGALSGLAIGWFLKPETLVNNPSLSPFAVAFLAGYSVELFFTAMDKFVPTFSSSAPKGQEKSGKTVTVTRKEEEKK